MRRARSLLTNRSWSSLAIQKLEQHMTPRKRWIAPKELDRLAEYGFKIRDEYVGVGATGQIFVAQDIIKGQDVAVKLLRGIYSHPRVAQNFWREVLHFAFPTEALGPCGVWNAYFSHATTPGGEERVSVH